MKPFFTVFTGTYNSASVIERLFISAKTQTSRDFEWIIIDDNSKDSTVDLIKEFLKENSDIKATLIIHEKNTGIAVSRLEALELAKGEFFVKWDHDDINKPDQLEVFRSMIKKYEHATLGAVWCLCEDEHGKIVGNKFPKDEYFSNYFGLYSTHIIDNNPSKNERHNCIRTNIHKEAVAFLCEKGLIEKPELFNATALWAALSLLGYKILFINKILRQYFIEPHRMSMSKKGRYHLPERVFQDRKNWINFYLDYLPWKDFLVKQRIFFSLNVYGIISGKSLKEIVSAINHKGRKVNSIIYYIPAWLLNRSGKL